MGVQPWVTGPNFISVGLQGGSLVFFGTAAYVPRPRIQRAFKPLMNAVAGSMLPFDNAVAGQHSVIVMSMSRFDWSLYLQMAAVTGGSDPGKLEFGMMGSLMNFEGLSMDIGIQFPYNVYSAFSDMPDGYIYKGCRMVADDPLEGGGCEGEIMNLMFESTSIYDPTDGSNTLYATSGSFPAGN